MATMVLLSSCKDDEKVSPKLEKVSPKLEFVFDGKTISLKGANLYLTGEYNTGGSNVGRPYRDYVISDGIYTNADGDLGWSLDDYDGATYSLVIELFAPVDGDITVGEFPSYANWDLQEDNSTISFIYLESGTGNDEISYSSTNQNNSPVVVSGGLEDGDKMTLKFDGTLIYRYFNGTSWVTNSVTGKFNYTGTVNDER
jgi:hypothetical protein